MPQSWPRTGASAREPDMSRRSAFLAWPGHVVPGERLQARPAVVDPHVPETPSEHDLVRPVSHTGTGSSLGGSTGAGEGTGSSAGTTTIPARSPDRRYPSCPRVRAPSDGFTQVRSSLRDVFTAHATSRGVAAASEARLRRWSLHPLERSSLLPVVVRVFGQVRQRSRDSVSSISRAAKLLSSWPTVAAPLSTTSAHGCASAAASAIDRSTRRRRRFPSRGRSCAAAGAR